MKVFVTGTRGIPNVPGGVEKHCQQLYPIIASCGHTVRLSRRSCYVEETRSEWNGVELIDCYAPKKKAFEAIIHTFMSLIEAKRWKPDVVHFHAVGPSLWIPFARMLGLKVVMTHHGPDYQRKKWGHCAKLALKLGEKLGVKYASEVIVISDLVKRVVEKKSGRKSHLIYNGVALPTRSKNEDFIRSLGLRRNGYILAVARFVPEKGLHDLLEAYSQSKMQHKLVIAGDADHEDQYSRELKEKAKKLGSQIVLPGYVGGEALNQLYSHARLFVLPSYYEGLPIALLEALSYNLPVLISNIPANLEVGEIGLDENRYFQVGNILELSVKLAKAVDNPGDSQCYREQLKHSYDWNQIAINTIKVYSRALGDSDQAYVKPPPYQPAGNYFVKKSA